MAALRKLKILARSDHCWFAGHHLVFNKEGPIGLRSLGALITEGPICAKNIRKNSCMCLDTREGTSTLFPV